ncbi:TPR repeat-containing protein YrrB [Legionella steelei]|uniref:TPR repeat-containing protein YrrB n=1 Tax=Legionella steelei TaxID=947033 RepID=A0A0W0ZL37_9GAMM|nr:tetratricopeptide repeat protein [Legionella steelei]KTD70028.1 TPR repeat-containing protein YrrB [Legionella steelei]
MNKKKIQNHLNKPITEHDFLTKKRAYICLIGLFIITVFIYANALENGLLNFDDNEYFTYPEITQLSWHNLKLYFSHYYLIMYQPIPVLSFAINHYFSQLKTIPLHGFNLIFHLLNVFLVYLFIVRLSQKRVIALIVAMLFAIHPMNVEAVTWISARSSSMYTFFYIIAILFYLNYIKLAQKKYLFFVGLAFLLSLFSKAQAVTLPLVLLVIDFYYSRINREMLQGILLEKTPFFILSCIFGIIAISDKNTIDNITNSILISYSYPEIICLICYSLVFYIYKIFVPIHLCAIYVYPPKINGYLPLIYYVSPFILLTLIGLVWQIARVKKYVQFGLLLFLISILINIQIIPSRLFIVTERYGYFPYIGIFFIIGSFYNEIKEEKLHINEHAKRMLYALLLLYSLIFMGLTVQRNTIWKDNISFMTDIIKKNPEVPYLFRAYGARANALINNNQLGEALADYTKAIEINPSEAISYLNRSLLYMKINNYSDAINDLDTAIKLQPNSAVMYVKRGLAKYASQDSNGALHDINQAIKLNQNMAEAYNLRAILRFSFNDYQGSKNDFDLAIKLNPFDSEVYKNRGIMFIKRQNKEAGCQDFNTSSRIGNVSAGKMIEQYCKAKATRLSV